MYEKKTDALFAQLITHNDLLRLSISGFNSLHNTSDVIKSQIL